MFVGTMGEKARRENKKMCGGSSGEEYRRHWISCFGKLTQGAHVPPSRLVMSRLLQYFLLGLVMAGVVATQLFGLQRGYLAVVEGVSFWTTADHHHCGAAAISSAESFDCLWLEVEPEDCDPADVHPHEPFVQSLQIQPTPGVNLPAPLLAVICELPLFSLEEIAEQIRTDAWGYEPPPMPLLTEAARVCRSVILLL